MTNYLPFPTYLPLLALLLLIESSCTRVIDKQKVVYSNNFERDSLSYISNGKISEFNGSKVIGRYSEGGFILDLPKLPAHDLLKISFDLYLHDSWDGNRSKPDGPDIWIMDIDHNNYVYTTFANGLCEGDSCETQSYPKVSVPFEHYKANSNAIRTDLPGVCAFKGKVGGTVMYRIERTIPHTGSSLNLGCFAQLEHGNSADPDCDESWSVDNLEVKAITYK